MEPYIRKVQYHETDMMGVAHHANYLHWMEEARIRFMEQLGFSYAEMEGHGIFSPVKSLACEYKRPCTFNDEIAITITVAGFTGAKLILRYEGHRGEEEIFTARSEHAFVDENGRVLRLRRAVPELSSKIELLCEHNKNAGET